MVALHNPGRGCARSFRATVDSGDKSRNGRQNLVLGGFDAPEELPHGTKTTQRQLMQRFADAGFTWRSAGRPKRHGRFPPSGAWPARVQTRRLEIATTTPSSEESRMRAGCWSK